MRTKMLSLISLLSGFAGQAAAQAAGVAGTAQGCYPLDTTYSDQGAYQYQSAGHCLGLCRDANKAVFAMADGNRCYCGNALPSGSMANAANCNLACAGYPDDTCGGTGYFSVFLTGVGTLSGLANSGAAVSAGGNSAATGQSSSTPQARTTTTAPVLVPTTIVQQGVTVIQTVTARASAAPSGSSSSQNSSNSSKQGGGSGISGGAIAGIVIGIVAILAIIGAGFFFWRRKQQRDESSLFSGQEYKRQIEPASGGTLARQGNGGGSFADTRLDTSLAMRRNSSESFADNQDYSRKILRVVN